MKHYPTVKAAQTAIGKSQVRGIAYSVKLEGVDFKGLCALRYVPRFRPATDEQRAIVERAKFEIAND